MRGKPIGPSTGQQQKITPGILLHSFVWTGKSAIWKVDLKA